MAGKKRSRKSVSSSTPRREQRQQSTQSVTKSGSAKTTTSTAITDADVAHHASAKSRRQKKKAGDNDVEERTPKQPKRCKLKDSENRPEGRQRNNAKNSQKASAAREYAHDEIVQHISTFLSVKSSSALTSAATPAGRDPTNSSDNNKNNNNNNMDVEMDGVSNYDKQRKEEPSDSISYLLDFLEVDSNNLNGNNNFVKSGTSENVASLDVIITKVDVATLLLPWAVGRLMRLAATSSSPSTSKAATNDDDDDAGVVGADDDAMNKSNNEVAWRALSSCFDILSPTKEGRADDITAGGSGAETAKEEEAASSIIDASCQALLSTSLSQSTLKRLVPYAARISFVVADTTKKSCDVQRDASNCFLHLAGRFRPSLDSACNSLLREVDAFVASSLLENDSTTNINSNSRNQSSQIVLLPTHQANVVSATLNMIHSLMSNANPKRLFGTICSREVLPSLGRMKMVVASDPSEINNNANEGQRSGDVTPSPGQLVQSILWDGLLNPTHHVDGFRIMNELHALPTLPKLCPEDNDDQTMFEDPPKGSGKGKGGGKACFQSTLFTSLQSLLLIPTTADDGEGGGGNAKAIHDATATASILPTIVHGFFERIRAHAKRVTVGGGTSSSEADAKLQFRFWCNAMLPALEQLFRMDSSWPSVSEREMGKLALALLEATSETLGLVLKFDAYLPSYSDPEERHLEFLQCVTKGLLRYITGNDESSEKTASPSTDQEIYSLETSFHHILLLNHRLLHEKLAHVISFACSCLPQPPSSQHQENPQRKNSHAKELLSSIVKTYRELRQVGYFLSSTCGAFTAAAGHRASQQSGDLAFMNNLLNCGNVLESLSMAYQSCPSGQLHEIWDFFDGWIVDNVVQKIEGQAESSKQADTRGANAELSFAVQMFIIFIKNIRANKQNSPELRSLCEKSLTTSISKLLGKTSVSSSTPINISADSEGNHGILMRYGFDLCGWLVDLHTRSCFWIENIDVDGQGSSFLLTQKGDAADKLNVLSYLRNAAEAALSSEKFKTWKESWLDIYWQSKADSDSLEQFHDIDIPLPLRGSLQRLALHRVHQLHSMIYYSNLQENERHASDLEEDHSSSQALTNEARMLVDFSLYIACSQITRQSGAHDIADELSESLWSPVAQSLCIWTHYSDPFHVELFLIWFFSTLCKSHPEGATKPLLGLEKTITMTLARDASFYDVSEAMSLLMKVGIQFAFTRFIDSVETARDSSTKIFQESSGLTVSCMELAEMADAKLSLGENVDTVSTALSFLASLPLELALCNENLNLLDRVLGLAIVSSQVIKRTLGERECSDPRLLKIVRSTRIIVANVLPKTQLFSSDFEATCLVNMTSQLSKSCLDFRFDDGVLSATGNAIGEHFSLCIDYHEKNASMLVNFFTQMGIVVRGAADFDFFSNALLVRSVIRRMNILDRHHSLSKKTPATASSYELCMSFVQETQKHLQSKIFQHIADAGNMLEYDKVAPVALLLASEIYSFIGNHLDTTPATNLLTAEQVEESRENVKKVFELIAVVQGSQHGLGFIEASNYFLSSMSSSPGHFLKCASPSIILESILGALAQSFAIRQESPLLDAAMCALIRNSDLEQTKIITTYVLRGSDCSKRDTSFIIKIFHLLMMCANSQEQHQHMIGECKHFLLISMGLLRDRSCERNRLVSNVKLFSKTMTILISKKELLLLSGREIAMICCEMSPLFSDDGVNQNDINGDVAIFNSCSSVAASLIAHYPKQLYGCPSPLFSLLLALLTHLLHANPKKGISQKALEFVKICELLIPHKDIFKKHVVGLILCYIQTLNKGMNPTTKSKLMPSIYALLDMCSSFETRQINAMIDVPSKTVFAPVFQSYQKFYQYHGQA